MFAQIKSLGLFGLDAYVVNVEVDISQGLPSFDIVGLPDAAVKESREREAGVPERPDGQAMGGDRTAIFGVARI